MGLTLAKSPRQVKEISLQCTRNERCLQSVLETRTVFVRCNPEFMTPE